MTIREKADLIKKNVTVQNYFDKMIIPAMSFYYDGEYVDFESKPTCKCPLHSEDTPSFRCYTYSNSFYCFGCGEGGDIIALHIKFMDINMATKVSFEEAVNYIYDTFVQGKEKTIRTTTFDSEEPLSTNIELIRFYKFRNELEYSMLKDNDTNLNKKILAYSQMDNIDKLVGMNLMNATDALDALYKVRNKMRPIAKMRPINGRGLEKHEETS